MFIRKHLSKKTIVFLCSVSAGLIRLEKTTMLLSLVVPNLGSSNTSHLHHATQVQPQWDQSQCTQDQRPCTPSTLEVRSALHLSWPVCLWKKLVMTLPKELVTRKWSWPSRTDRPRLRWCLLSLPWSAKPSRSHQETEISKRILNTMEMSLLTRLSTLPG